LTDPHDRPHGQYTAFKSKQVKTIMAGQKPKAFFFGGTY